MEAYYLAVDIGASNGRHILGSVQNGRLVLEEVYRFRNRLIKQGENLCWDLPYLFHEVLYGMQKCQSLGKIPVSMGIDSWAVDYVLLDKQDQVLGPAYCYRDRRTRHMDQLVYQRVPEAELYRRTGIQKQIFNTVYQLMAHQVQYPQVMERADALLMIPDYLHYRLTEKKALEYTNASTTQLVSPQTRDWDWELIERLGYPKRIFQRIRKPGFFLGSLSGSIQKQVGFCCKVVPPCTHDTASAVAAVPAPGEQPLYLSSGTWSLMGTEISGADCSEKSRLWNFTNEGGCEDRFCFLKNIMGLWITQSVRREWQDAYSYDELCEMAEKETAFPSRIDINEDGFLAPDSMVQAIMESCRQTGQPVPQTPGQIAAVIYHSLAECYGKTVKEVEALTGKTDSVLHIVGGGAKADYLNRLALQYTGKTVCAGPSEATAIGNLVLQMIQDGIFSSLTQARKCIRDSFAIKIYKNK